MGNDPGDSNRKQYSGNLLRLGNAWIPFNKKAKNFVAKKKKVWRIYCSFLKNDSMHKYIKGSEKFYCKEICLALFNLGFYTIIDCGIFPSKRHLLTFLSIIVLSESLKGAGVYGKGSSSLCG